MEPITIFLHIEKTGGISIRNLFESNIPGSKLLKLYGDAPAKIKEFNRLPAAEQSTLKALCGHVDFGIHQQFGFENYRYITLLRDPVERMISFYYYFIKNPSEFTTYGFGHQLDFKSYLERGIHAHIDNGQTRRLAGVSHLEAGACNQSHLETAKHNIENHIAVTGLLEYFEESLLLLKESGILENVYYLEANKSNKRPAQKDVPADIIDTIKKTNALDIQLYQFALDRFNLQIKNKSDLFVKELNALKRHRLESRSAFRSFDKGLELYRDDEIQNSRSLFSQTIRSAQSVASDHEIIIKSWFYLGEIARSDNDNQSRNCYLKSLELLDGKSHKTDEELYLTASLLKRLERYNKALEHFQELVKRSPLKRFTSGACFHMGEIYHELGDDNSAAHMMKETLRLNPVHRDAMEYLKNKS